MLVIFINYGYGLRVPSNWIKVWRSCRPLQYCNIITTKKLHSVTAGMNCGFISLQNKLYIFPLKLYHAKPEVYQYIPYYSFGMKETSLFVFWNGKLLRIFSQIPPINWFFFIAENNLDIMLHSIRKFRFFSFALNFSISVSITEIFQLYVNPESLYLHKNHSLFLNI